MKQQNVGQDCNILLHVLGSEIQKAKISTLKELGGLSQGNTTLCNYGKLLSHLSDTALYLRKLFEGRP